MKVFSAPVSVPHWEVPRTNLLSAPLAIRRTPWASPTATASSYAPLSATPSATIDSSSPRALPSASPELHQDPLHAMDESHRGYPRRPGSESLPPFHVPNTNASSGFQVGHGSSYLPSPSQHSPSTSLPNNTSFPLPSPSHHSSSVSLSNANSYHVPTTGSQFSHQQHQQHQQQHHQHQHQHQHQQQQQLPSPTHHSPPTGTLGGSNEYHHAPSSGGNYSLSTTYPVMAPPSQYRPQNFSYQQQMPLPGSMSSLHHHQSAMGFQGNPHMHHLPQHYMYAAQSGPQQLDRPFKSDQCTQSFSRNHDLKRHKRIHLAVKPFPCNYCSKQFSRKDALKVPVVPRGKPLPPFSPVYE